MVKVFGVMMIALGCFGLFLGHIMVYDLSVNSTYTGIVAIATGVGFLKMDDCLARVKGEKQ